MRSEAGRGLVWSRPQSQEYRLPHTWLQVHRCIGHAERCPQQLTTVGQRRRMCAPLVQQRGTLRAHGEVPLPRSVVETSPSLEVRRWPQSQECRFLASRGFDAILKAKGGENRHDWQEPVTLDSSRKTVSTTLAPGEAQGPLWLQQ
mmetsp:Transcript_118479/g.330522  ORF Transcript_118479/g.330522 Transcript_118479/m.330522 type:complete len:146 (-) Transcript_118479:1164-1601(-)